MRKCNDCPKDAINGGSRCRNCILKQKKRDSLRPLRTGQAPTFDAFDKFERKQGRP